MLRNLRTMHIKAIPMFSDNYAYLLKDERTNDAWIIDPSEPSKVSPVLASEQINLKAIVNTHHHFDHSGGNAELKVHYPQLPIIAGKNSPLVSQTPADGEKLQLGSIEITAIHTPCHTQDSICYFVKDGDQKAVITGDTLFNAGCGRFFEGNAQEMCNALAKLRRLPAETIVYSGHEYTKSNANFAHQILGSEVDGLLKYCNEHKVTTGIFTIGDEEKFNPFIRVDERGLQEKLGVSNQVEAMAKLRELKNKL